MVRTCRSCGQKNRIKPAQLASVARCGRCKALIGPTAEPIDVDEQGFDEVVRSSPVPVLVDFWAAWCGPCRMAAPEVKKVAEQLAGRVVVLKVDSDRYPGLSARYNIRGIPNFLVLKAGQVVAQHAGVVPHTEMVSWLEQAGA